MTLPEATPELPTKRRYKERRDKGQQRAPRETRPCRVCDAPVTRRPEQHRERTYCSRGCFYQDVSTIGREVRAAGGAWGRPAGEDARPFACSDGRTRASSLRPDGYRHVHWPEHPDANAASRVTEHRLVMETMLDRRLLSSENVHHRNGVRDDNDPGNLELWSKTQPLGQRVVDKVAFARAVLGLYGSDGERSAYAEHAGELT